MSDYQPLDLGQYTNAYDDLVIPGAKPRLGQVSLRGLPFTFAVENGRARVIHLVSGQQTTIRVNLPSPCKTITFAHRVSSFAGPMLNALGREDAVYVFKYSSGEDHSVSIREGFEIEAPWLGDEGHWGLRPSLALPDEHDRLPSRTHGAFADIGLRQTEVVEAGEWNEGASESGQGRPTWRFYLWSWINPHPDERIVEVQLIGQVGAIDIGAMSIGFVSEHPLRPEPARVVVGDMPPEYLAAPRELAIEVDRGSVGYTTAVKEREAVSDPLATWGDRPEAACSRVYARVSAVPSATVRLLARGRVLHEARWRDLRKGELPKDAPLRITERGRNWVRSHFVDDDTNEMVACRVHFSSPEGVPFQPHGHHQHVNSDLGSWHSDVGGDLRLGCTTYAYVNGSCEGWLPSGPVHVQIARGFEYQPIDALVAIGEDTQSLTFRLKRAYDPAAEGWYSGDTHVHFLSSVGGLLEASAEGLSVVNLLQSQWGSLFTSTEEFIGRTLASPDGKVVVYASQENRQHFLGHLSLLGLKTPVMPWCSDGPSEAEMGGGLEATLSDWADRCHAQGGTVVVPHFPVPHGEVAALIATQRADALELPLVPELAYQEYYRYLNAGFTIPLAGGTDKMSSDVPVGLRRTYVKLEPGRDFGFTSWCEGLKAGRTFVSSGPLLDVSVDGVGVGGEVTLPERGGSVSVRARARSIFPIFNLEVVCRGRVIAATHNARGAHELSIAEECRFDEPGWICARVGGGPSHLTRHRDEYHREIVAHSSPIYVGCGSRHRMYEQSEAQYLMGLVERSRSYVTELASWDAGSDVLHHHHGDHREYLERPFEEARQALSARLRS